MRWSSLGGGAAAGSAVHREPRQAARTSDSRCHAGRAPVDRSRALRLRRSTYRRSYRANTGEEVNVVLSSAFPQNDAYKQYWANFLAGLVHGFELPYATIFLASASDKAALCGPDPEILACYLAQGGPYRQMLVINLQPPPAFEPFTEEITAHEYGHHVAWNRDNRPWDAFDFGPKRWASYEGICPRTRGGTAFPGDPQHYDLDPGEAFAEHYRVATGGDVDLALRASVDASFYPPDGEDLRLVRQDVRSPWRGNAVRRWRGRLRGGRTQTSKVFRTPLDGTIRVSVGGRRGSDFDLFLKQGRRTVKRATTAGGDSFTYRICGPARVRVVVKRHSGRATRFRVRFSRP